MMEGWVESRSFGGCGGERGMGKVVMVWGLWVGFLCVFFYFVSMWSGFIFAY